MSKKSLVKQEFKKHVGAIHTSGELTLLERKLVNVMLLNAYDDLLTKRTHSISVRHLAEMLGWDASNNVERLQDALRKIVGTTIEFNIMDDGTDGWEITSLLSYAKIKNGVCSYKYVEELAEKLFDPEVYATINIGVQKKFNGGYSLTLYENCLRYRSVGSTGWWDIPKFRRIMGATAPMYDEFKRLNSFVIGKAVTEINKQSDIHITPEFRKIGRKVDAVKFLIKEHQQLSLVSTPESLDGNEALRETEAFKRLREHGIGDKLAIAWILQDEGRARDVVDYVEDKDRKKQVKGSTAGYIRTLYEGGAEVKKPAYETKKAEAIEVKAQSEKQTVIDERRIELEQRYKKELNTRNIRALTFDQRKSYIARYIEEKGQGAAQSYNPESGEFKNSLERVPFDTWLRILLAPEISLPEFKIWLQSKNIDPQSLGI